MPRLPRISGRKAAQASESCAISSRARTGSLLRPWMIWTNPAWSGLPARSTTTWLLSRNVGSPANSFAVSAHHWSCSGRSLFRRASSSDSKRTTAMRAPLVGHAGRGAEPAGAPGATSWDHPSIAARNAAASLTRPSITCTNIANLLRRRTGCLSASTVRRCAAPVDG